MNSCSSSADFYAKLAGVFIDTSLALTRIFLTDNWRNVQELEKNGYQAVMIFLIPSLGKILL